MQTSCPECRTTFRVSQEQLGLRRGLVRCGSCNAVFNAYDTLLPELENPPASVTEEAEAPAQESLPFAPAAFEPAETPPADLQAAYREAGIDLAAGMVAYAEAAEAVEAERPEAWPQAVTEPEPEPLRSLDESPDAILLSELPTRQVRARLPWWQTVLYLFGTLLLLLVLLGQAAYFLRAELAAAVPEARPLLEGACDALGCDVPLPRQLTRQAIVSSSLEHDPEQKSRVSLTFLLANRTGQTQAWPHVILTLSDVREAPVAQKAFAPDMYLPRTVSPRAGFPARSEQEARVELDVGNLEAASYVLAVAYP
ncbi:MAG: DUF3426 domain-containing protein [Pseudomonadota bacterium]